MICLYYHVIIASIKSKHVEGYKNLLPVADKLMINIIATVSLQKI
jgi:hypothetical protein